MTGLGGGGLGDMQEVVDKSKSSNTSPPMSRGFCDLSISYGQHHISLIAPRVPGGAVLCDGASQQTQCHLGTQ